MTEAIMILAFVVALISLATLLALGYDFRRTLGRFWDWING